MKNFQSVYVRNGKKRGGKYKFSKCFTLLLALTLKNAEEKIGKWKTLVGK